MLDFIYDESGRPFALKYSTNGGSSFTTCYYVVNLMGDVVGLANGSGTLLVEYSYNAWGEPLAVTVHNSDYTEVANTNPLRYRGYYYDSETGWYYLQSRYYDPVLHRFINADSYASTGQGFLGTNMFAYCLNNPILFKDDSGESVTVAVSVLAIEIFVTVIGLTVACAYICDPGFRDAFNNAVISVVDTFASGIEVIDEAVDGATEMFSSQCKVISDSIAESFAKVKEIPNYAGKREIHHIVAKRAPNAVQARKILDDVGIGYNSSYNLVSLKAGLHRRLHTNMYYGWANSIIISAYNSACGNKEKQRTSVLNALKTIEMFLLTMDAASPF